MVQWPKGWSVVVVGCCPRSTHTLVSCRTGELGVQINYNLCRVVRVGDEEERQRLDRLLGTRPSGTTTRCGTIGDIESRPRLAKIILQRRRESWLHNNILFFLYLAIVTDAIFGQELGSLVPFLRARQFVGISSIGGRLLSPTARRVACWPW